MTLRELHQALDANNRRYRDGAISRAEWTARNRELADLAKPLGLTLPAFARDDATPQETA